MENKTWLKFNLEPWSLVCEKWRETSKNRTTEFNLSNSKNITEFLAEWPAYKHYLAYELVILLCLSTVIKFSLVLGNLL